MPRHRTAALTALLLFLAACGAGTGTSAAPGRHYRVTIAEIGQILPVVQVVQGFQQALARAGLVAGKNVTYTIKTANLDETLIPAMAQQVVESKPDLILAAGTPVVLALHKDTGTIPILFGGMTDPVGAGVVKSARHPGTNLTGTSDYLSPDAVLDLVASALPKARRIGVIGNPSEQNTASELRGLSSAARARHLELITAPVFTTSDVLPALRSLIGRIDVLVVPEDNTVGAAFPTVAQTLLDARIPVIASDTLRAQQGQALAGIGIDYHQLGILTGKQAVEILLHGAKPADIPVIYGNSPAGGGLKVVVNTSVARRLAVSLPQNLLKHATVVS
jgi:putative ABC transport system substrate-binding protein